MLISRITEETTREKERDTTTTTDFQPLNIITLIINQFDFISVIHQQKFLLRINRCLDVNVLMKV